MGGGSPLVHVNVYIYIWVWFGDFSHWFTFVEVGEGGVGKGYLFLVA